MDDIKFRAFDKRTNTMIAEDFHVIGEHTMFGAIQLYVMEHHCNMGILERLGDVIVTQYSTFNDKNEKDIYVGDFFAGYGVGIKYFEVRFEKGEMVLYNNFGRWGTLGRFFEVAKDFGVDVIVKGNIFDSPEILNS